jgi:hypothetical protein
VSLWQDPGDLAERDLFNGQWGPEYAPDPDGTYVLVEHKHTGINPGLTVRDEQGRQWSVKQGPPDGSASEGPIEVVLSRVLSAVGYHQPPVYHLDTFTLRDDWGRHQERGGRFRVKVKGLKDCGDWSWQQNAFVGTRPYHGLLVILLLFNSTDLKNSNNTLYERRGAAGVEQWLVVRDLGSALGGTGRLAPRRGDPEAFARHPFIKGVSRGFVEFNYHGWHQELIRGRITPADVAWVGELLGRLSDRQWIDAFRAGGYSGDAAAPYLQTIRSRLGEARQLAAAGTVTTPESD